MNNVQFQHILNSTAETHLAFRHQPQKWNLHRLMYIIRTHVKMDCSLSSNTGECIPSVYDTFVPLEWLARPVSNFEYDEEYNVLFFDFLDKEVVR